MKSVSYEISYILLVGAVIAIAISALPWVNKQIQLSFDKAEIKNVKSQFMRCAEKILETARTGSSNKCIFSVSRGDLYVKEDGIYYKLSRDGKICEEHKFALIDYFHKLWERCKRVKEKWTYELKWFYPKNDSVIVNGDVIVEFPSGSKTFELINKGVASISFETPIELKGKMIEVVRRRVEKDKVILSVKIY